jgi:2-methylisocitrate lyase-like PEP mutase family enzyme
MELNTAAATLKKLHKPGAPLVLPNIWDVASLNAVLSLNSEESQPVKAIATASWAIAAALGVKDEELTLDQNLTAIARLAPHARRAGLPLTVDLQDGYGLQIANAVRAVVESGAHGANIEDSIPSAGYSRGLEGSLYALEEQVTRLTAALSAAKNAGCQNFVLNARCDIFRLEPPVPFGDNEAMDEAVSRGKAYLQLGATTVFYWGGKRGLSRGEVERLVRELGGRVAVKLSDKTGSDPGLSVEELRTIGVARISVGPSLFMVAAAAVKETARRILLGGHLGV